MTTVTFAVLDGVDKGRVFSDLPIPATIGREGNLLRLNDERVSRFHAKVQQDNGDIILTDLDSTNGTRVNNNVVQIRRLRPGDKVCVGRTVLQYGTAEQIVARMASSRTLGRPPKPGGPAAALPPASDATVQAQTFEGEYDDDFDFDLNLEGEITLADDALFVGQHALPPLPQKMSPAQAARTAEILDFLHRGLTRATENIHANEENTLITLTYPDWQRILRVQMLLARYLRAIAEPDSFNE